MNELEEEYKDRIDFYRFEITTPEGECEYNMHEFVENKIPAMVYVDTDGNEVELTEQILSKDVMKEKLDHLLEVSN